ncbi:MAG: hypothetical protein VX689_01460 [Bacteroidota bacterium]|nr:hypothetical protein [Bacteroidota bacterium]
MYKILNILVVILFFSGHLFAQISTSSPYSRFGLGELQQNVLSEFNAFGGASIALSNSTSINPNNPASYASFVSKSFLLSTGGWHQTTQLDNGDVTQILNNTGFGHLVLGFPLGTKFGSSFGMIPFSSTGYEMRTRNSNYNADMNYYGDGGLSKVYFGGAYKDLNGFSLGINASYLFGGLNRRKQLVYDDESFLNSRSNNKINLTGFYYELGLLYKKGLNENDEFSVGLTINNESSIRAKRTVLVESFEFSGFFEVPQDTFINSVEWGDVTLPKCISTGIAYSKNKQWLFLADYSIQNWSDYSMFDESDNLVSSMKICGGIEYTPEYNSITKYYKKINYRFGASYSNTPLQFDDNQLNEMSISFGFGIPVSKSRTKYDFACTLGQRGTTEGNLIKEQFVRLSLSISYDGIWFVKRKYD